MHEALERMMERLAFGPEVDLQNPSERRAFLSAVGVTGADADALAEGELERLGVYRRLVRENLRDALAAAIPCTMARLGGVFDEYFDRFLAERGPRTHYLRDVTDELLTFVAPLWPGDPRVPAYALDLARHEAVQILVGSQKVGRRAAEPQALELERGVQFVEAVRLMRYGWAVHRLSDDVDDRTEPVREAIALFVYRNPEHEVRYLETTPLAAAILERLLDGSALGAAIREAAAALDQPLDASVIEGSSRLLADLAERGALLGAAEEKPGS